MIRNILIFASLLTVMTATAFAQEATPRTEPLNALDANLVGDYTGRSSGALTIGQGDQCTVSFKYHHEEKYGDTVLLYYKVALNFIGMNYNDTGFDAEGPEDFEFLVSRDYLMNYWPNETFEVSTYVDRTRDYKRITLRFDNGGNLKSVTASFSYTGEPTEGSHAGWFGGYTCKVN